MSDKNKAVQKIAQPSSFSLPFLWPLQYQQIMIEEGMEVAAKNMKFLNEEMRFEHGLKPTLATPNIVRLDLRTMKLREYGSPVEGGIPTHVLLTDWKSATPDMANLEVDPVERLLCRRVRQTELQHGGPNEHQNSHSLT